MSGSGVRKILDGGEIDRALSRIAEEILERNTDHGALALIGIRTRGVPLAQRIARRLSEIRDLQVPVGLLDITLYRDDFTTIGSQPILRKTEIEFAITEREIVLVDDVLFTGRTIRAGLDGLIDFGRPRRIQLAVLVDRGHRELPIRADFVGKTLSTTTDEFVQVNLEEIDGDGEDGVSVGDIVRPRNHADAAKPQ